MAGLGPAIHETPRYARRQVPKVTAGWVYVMTNRPNGIIYVGVTDNLPRRAWEHREGLVDGFTKRYGLKRLVYYAVR
jgi:putative endonuclease